jgi:hypothetical protein
LAVGRRLPPGQDRVQPLPAISQLARRKMVGERLAARHYTDFGPVEIGTEEYFMMGDNRPSSSDSRQFGAIHESCIIGRAFVVIWPVGRFATLPVAGYDGFEGSTAAREQAALAFAS